MNSDSTLSPLPFMSVARVSGDVLRLQHNGGTNCCVQLLVREFTVWAHLCCRLHVYSFTKPQLWYSDVALLDHRNLYLDQDRRIDVSIKILDLGNLRSHLARRGRVRPSPIMLIHQPAHLHLRSTSASLTRGEAGPRTVGACHSERLL